MRCFFVSDLHGQSARYRALREAVVREMPDAVLLGGDLLPGGYGRSADFQDFMDALFLPLVSIDGPEFFVIMGNDDPRAYEPHFLELDRQGVIEYVHKRAVPLGDYFVAGYSYVPPTPFRLKDWERYDVSRFVDVGTVSPEEGSFSVDVDMDEIKFTTIQKDLENLGSQSPPVQTIYLFHSPPFGSCLDRADLDGRMVDHAPVDVHVGSIAIQKFIKNSQPLVTLHGHIHESARMSGCWRETFGRTHSFSAAHDGPELALVKFDPGELDSAERILIKPD